RRDIPEGRRDNRHSRDGCETIRKLPNNVRHCPGRGGGADSRKGPAKVRRCSTACCQHQIETQPHAAPDFALHRPFVDSLKRLPSVWRRAELAHRPQAIPKAITAEEMLGFRFMIAALIKQQKLT